jgi:inverted formin-2
LPVYRQINLLDAKRSLNVNIFIRQFHSPGGASPQGTGPSPADCVIRFLLQPDSRHGESGSATSASPPADVEDGPSSMRTLTADSLRNLLKILPDDEEIKALRSYDGDRQQLGQAERFLLELLDLPE